MPANGGHDSRFGKWVVGGCESGDHGELVPGKVRYSDTVRAELEAMSPATIDRYICLRPV